MRDGEHNVNVHIDSALPEESRRQRIFRGDVFVFSTRPAITDLRDFAAELIEEAFAPLDPRQAQYDLDVQTFVDIVAPLKPRFIHHPKTKDLLAALLADLGCDMDDTYFDVPRMRVSTAGGYLDAGVAYPAHPHRDTWYSQPAAQLNWWMPVYDYDERSGFEFYPDYFDRPIRNTSRDFNYYEWNATGRKDAAKYITSDTRKQPRPEEALDTSNRVALVVPAGGLMLFSSAQLHATVPNTSGRSRFSVDFRTANITDLTSGNGGPYVDASCTGTSLHDLMRGTDRTPLPDDLIGRYDSGVTEDSILVFRPPDSDPPADEPYRHEMADGLP